MTTKLLPCPFCGEARAKFVRTGTARHSCIVQCTSCGTCHESSDEGDRSGSSWNDRVEMEKHYEQILEVRRI